MNTLNKKKTSDENTLKKKKKYEYTHKKNT